MSAVTLLFGMLAFSAPTDVYFIESAVVLEPVVLEPAVVLEPVSYIQPNITCSQCVNAINNLKNETVFLNHLAKDVEYVCGKIFGPAAHQCVNVTQDIRNGLAYINNHTSTEICHTLHYCS